MKNKMVKRIRVNPQGTFLGNKIKMKKELEWYFRYKGKPFAFSRHYPEYKGIVMKKINIKGYRFFHRFDD